MWVFSGGSLHRWTRQVLRHDAFLRTRKPNSRNRTDTVVRRGSAHWKEICRTCGERKFLRSYSGALKNDSNEWIWGIPAQSSKSCLTILKLTCSSEQSSQCCSGTFTPNCKPESKRNESCEMFQREIMQIPCYCNDYECTKNTVVGS